MLADFFVARFLRGAFLLAGFFESDSVAGGGVVAAAGSAFSTGVSVVCGRWVAELLSGWLLPGSAAAEVSLFWASVSSPSELSSGSLLLVVIGLRSGADFFEQGILYLEIGMNIEDIVEVFEGVAKLEDLAGCLLISDWHGCFGYEYEYLRLTGDASLT